ncbi:hypothetical protein DL93DRAFT_2088646 [Clavulina sp. PMI_390]|nr:hypothetical protein DL93DRAFT_2088646 [Clavulina sp. PMI_390]
MGSPASPDFDAVLRADSYFGYQMASVIAPPAYIALSLIRRRPFSINRTLRATWLSGAVGAGAGFGYGWYEGTLGRKHLQTRHLGIAYDVHRIKNDDHATIGAALFAVLTPALFWSRARAVHLVLGGAGLGTAIGVATNAYRMYGDPNYGVGGGGPGPVLAPPTSVTASVPVTTPPK